MGQYYKCFNLDQHEYLYPHAYDNGAKLMEHSYIGNNMLNVAEHLLSPNGSWHKTRIVWGGDYMDDHIFVEDIEVEGNIRSLLHEKGNLYEFAIDFFKQVNLEFEEDPTLRFIVNHSKKQFADKTKVREGNYGLKIHPLPLLTSSGNGRGGGDYFDETNSYVGTWAGDVISFETDIPNGYEEIVPDFIEE